MTLSALDSTEPAWIPENPQTSAAHDGLGPMMTRNRWQVLFGLSSLKLTWVRSTMYVPESADTSSIGPGGIGSFAPHAGSARVARIAQQAMGLARTGWVPVEGSQQRCYRGLRVPRCMERP